MQDLGDSGYLCGGLGDRPGARARDHDVNLAAQRLRGRDGVESRPLQLGVVVLCDD